MKKRRHPLSWLCILWFLSSLASAEIIDKMVAVVEGHIITLSDIRQEREIRRLLEEKPPESDIELLHDMVDKYLIERQSTNFPGVDVTDEEIDAQLRNGVIQGQTPSPAIRAAIASRIRMQKYLDLRFRQFIRPTDEEIRKYYNEVFLPAAKKGSDPIPPLSEISEAIRNNVILEQLNREVTDSLEAVRMRSSIEYFE
jgi:hypothetical protein